MYELLAIDRDGAVATITLNNPKKRNALSHAMMGEIAAAFSEVGKTDAQVIVLAANGPVFSAGHDLSELVGADLAASRALFGVCVAMVDAIQSAPQPVIAKVHGPAAAGGCQLALTCDLVVAADTATFALPGIKRGLFCHTPLVAVARNTTSKRAFEMAATGDPVAATTAAEWGMINYAVPPEELDAAVAELAGRITGDGSPYARSLGKKTYYTQIGLAQRPAYDLAVEMVALNAVLPDAQEGFASFVEKRPPVFTMAANA